MYYTLANASHVLGVSKTTIRRWIAQDNIKKVLLEIDKTRAYISHRDLMMLSDKHCRKLGKLPQKTKQANNSQHNTVEEQELYSVVEVAKFIDVSGETVRRWIVEDEIEKKYIVTDRKRIHISYHDALLLAIMHGRKTQNDNKLSNNLREKGFYTVKDASIFIGVSTTTVREWIEKYNINKNMIGKSKKQVYIHHSDVMLLAEQHQSNISPEKRHAKDLYTIKDIALLLGVSTHTVGVWIDKLNIPKNHMPGDKKRIYIHHTDVLTLAHQRQNKSKTTPKGPTAAE